MSCVSKVPHMTSRLQTEVHRGQDLHVSILALLQDLYMLWLYRLLSCCLCAVIIKQQEVSRSREQEVSSTAAGGRGQSGGACDRSELGLVDQLLDLGLDPRLLLNRKSTQSRCQAEQEQGHVVLGLTTVTTLLVATAGSSSATAQAEQPAGSWCPGAALLARLTVCTSRGRHLVVGG